MPGVEIGKQRNFTAQRFQIQKVRLQRIVQVGGVVRDFIHPIDQLRFQRRPQIQKVFGQLGKFGSGVIARVLHDAFADFERQIEPLEANVAMLKMLDDAQCVQIVIKAATMGTHQFIEFALSRVTERGDARYRGPVRELRRVLCSGVAQQLPYEQSAQLPGCASGGCENDRSNAP